MPVVTLLQAPPDEPLKSQLLQLVVDAFTDLSSTALPPSNALYNLYQYGLGFEVHLYLQALGSSRLPVELVLACADDDPQQLLGFALCLPVEGEPAACAVAWMAVHQAQRRRGIGRALLDQIRQHYARVELACAQGKVPCFEALGFEVEGVRDTQVLMASGAAAGDGVLVMLDVAPVWRTLEIQQIHSYLLKQHGRKAMVEAEKKRDRHLDELTRHARAFVLQRVGQMQGREIRLV